MKKASGIPVALAAVTLLGARVAVDEGEFVPSTAPEVYSAAATVAQR